MQFIANGFFAGCIYALLALGFSLIYNTTRVFHFGYGGVYTLAGYGLFVFFRLLNLPLWAGILLALTVAVLGGVALDELVTKPLARRGASPLVMMLSALASYMVVVHCMALAFGNHAQLVSPGAQPIVDLKAATVTRIQIQAGLVSIVLSALGMLLIKRTVVGQMISALRDDDKLLAALGNDPSRIRTLVFAFGSLFAGVAAVLTALDTGIDPYGGMPAFLIAAISVVIGGTRVYAGAILGGFVLAFIQNIAVSQISARWQDAVTFVTLVLFLLFRPLGLLGVHGRVEESA